MDEPGGWSELFPCLLSLREPHLVYCWIRYFLDSLRVMLLKLFCLDFCPQGGVYMWVKEGEMVSPIIQAPAGQAYVLPPLLPDNPVPFVLKFLLIPEYSGSYR